MIDFASFAPRFRAYLGDNTACAVIALPGEEPRFYTCPDFFYVPWPDTGPYTIPEHSTEKDGYIAGIAKVINDCKLQHGKTVISTVTVVDTDEYVAGAIEFLANADPSTFRCLMHTPDYGTWVCATPELLLDYRPGYAATMALAGTRRHGAEAWRVKEQIEQEFVSDHITRCLEPFANEILVEPKGTLSAGGVDHIVTHISADLKDNVTADMLLAQLPPTPAVCGTPRAHAMQVLAETERHARGMYGGYFGVQLGDGNIIAAVMLRCAQITPQRAILYAGGGITEMSDPQAEWEETRLKAANLLKFFTTKVHK